MDIIARAAANLNLPLHSVSATAGLLAQGDSIPFISRYRKEVTGNLNELEIRSIETEISRLTALHDRRQAIMNSIEEQGKLTGELRQRLEEAASLAALEDIYLPFRPRRRTRATIAREQGLEPLAKMLMSARGLADPEQAAARFVKGEVDSAAKAIAGAKDIIAEWVSESQRARNGLRGRFRREAVIEVKIAKGREADASNFKNYDGFSRPLRHIASHQYLAIRRGEGEGLLKVSVKIDDAAAIDGICAWFISKTSHAASRDIIAAAVADGYKRLLRPSIETEMSAEWKENADTSAIDLFSDNLRQLLLAPPLRGKCVLAIDPGFRTGCKLAVVDSSGALLDDDVIYPNEPRRDTPQAMKTVLSLIDSYDVEAIALGDRTASRETEAFLRSSGITDFTELYIVSENGASVYSA